MTSPRSTAHVALLRLLGPAIVAGVAYLDPGNVASNMTAGARFGYLLVWVVVLGNLMAWLIQYLSAKLGLITGRSLSELVGDRLRHRWSRRAYWLQAETVSMATDVAEVIGGAIALNLLTNLPLIAGGLITGAVSIVLLLVQARGGARPFEYLIAGLMVLVSVGFTAGVVVDPPDGGATVAGLVPHFAGRESVLLAASILGATVMPHAIYAHSALTRDRFGHLTGTESRRRFLIATRIDVTVALTIAGTVNLAILLLAAHSLSGVANTDSLDGAHAAISVTLGPVVATLFAVGLLASGLASTAVGAYAGAEIMSGLLHVRIPLTVRRVVTLLPALLVLTIDVDPTRALLLSQVVLSFGIPFALVPLVLFTRDRRLMGDMTNQWFTTLGATLAAVSLIVLNSLLLWLTILG
ncbi:Nramp family divalent metal transporter [Rathayibacter toxicus]|uniref:Divalent metal cation transporter MntH n=1 Tax=Rathayibacter toxicus TaxID=145458 RepID=A0A0C5BB68_9MICO|nr:Nramp family divalent metal transporter [Rathayibacter toxicus]AJM78123.1 manganese transporter [Rathayibacter toxicus]ALS57621.1 manganese transporter [Rathayibacter toxicus]KKM44974.1 manganese transporter [Rathayibacter toxicus]PPG20708.1 divalent metal cation transporter MntH [Rathayibacter toxicus]PPG45812.1 divalent metal cation transporter MntH [Rathayibacter toxicus]